MISNAHFLSSLHLTSDASAVGALRRWGISAVANICPNFDDDDSGVDGEYDRRSDHRSNAISRCKYMSQLWALASMGPTIVQAGAC